MVSRQALDPAASSDINQKYREYVRRVPIDHVPKDKLVKRVFGGFRYNARVLMLPALVCAGLLMIIRLRIGIALQKGRIDSSLHGRALTFVDDFVEQYPFGLYMILTKAFSSAFIKKQIEEHVDPKARIAEVAIGDGTYSARLFDRGQRITATDLNPYSLVKASKLGHVGQAIVCDGVHPPMQRGAFDLLVSCHFLSHVSQKDVAISNWSRAAGLLLFDECTPFWGTGMATSYVFKKLGLKRIAGKMAKKIVEQGIQHLETFDALERHVRAHCEVLGRESFMNERTLFLCTIFGLLQFNPSTGPTVPLLKMIALGPLRWLIIPMTRSLGKLLIQFDAFQDRSQDAMAAFFCKSLEWESSNSGCDLQCPRCSGSLSGENRCVQCGMTYPLKDGMLFLLANEFQDIADDYNAKVAAEVRAEQH
jgi:ubiquinone/menaquinone biosynthesis C-methylase UbiE/uncharacterized protein YbaR (Trm112 family)